MKINTLISALYLNEDNLIKQNLSGEVIVINQDDYNDVKNIDTKKSNITIYTNTNRGIGKSRNEALKNSNAEICVLADDDEVFLDNYLEIIKSAYEKYPYADLILFNVKRNDDPDKIKEVHQVNYKNALKYGAVNITFKKEAIIKGEIKFSELFGGGTKFGSGEDSKFIIDCLKNHLNIVACNETIATINDVRESTWFKGYNDKFFFDKGALFSSFNLKFGYIMGLIVMLKSFKNKGDLTTLSKLIIYTRGFNYYKKSYLNKEQQL
ncbi:glycosyltransferase family 2 protein [Macrococcus capreoli]|uniref:glycosyltransferase n=1 Tax=Macrococcus capreoli TaxID=2982690 RepID=UPI0021D58B06|nr:glycosyltransferase family A protein [Macrococcus sp. TMW 2.2395]MCU7557540.1 glycosyltransferase family 2 protein [Macrococcus sp. TMW 2.2395]